MWPFGRRPRRQSPEAQTARLGRQGEKLACRLLGKKGIRALERLMGMLLITIAVLAGVFVLIAVAFYLPLFNLARAVNVTGR